MVDNNDIKDILKIVGIIFGLFHFVLGIALYTETLRINRVIKTSQANLVKLISTIYIALLLIIVILFIVV